MKKRLISLLVALCMAVTLLPVSAITAWAEESSSNSTTLRIKYGYPVGSRDSNGTYTISCSGDGWSYDGTTKTLKLNPTSPTEYDFSSLSSDGNTLNCALEIGAKATITSGSFTNDITNHGIVSGGTFSPIESVKLRLTFANYGIITDGTFYAPINTPSTSFELSNYRTIEGGNFRNSSSNFSFSNQGSINGGIFSTAPDHSIKLGYILKCSGNLNNIFNATCYVIPNTNSTYPTKITASFDFGALSPFDVTINNTQQMLLTEWAGKVESSSDPDRLYVTFTAPPAKANTVTLSKLTRLVIDENGYPVGTKGGTQGYSGNGWSYNHTDKTLTLNPSTPTSYDFSGEGNALNPNVHLEVESGAKLTGGAFAKEPKGAGTFKTVTLNGTDPITAVNGLASGDWGNKLYVVPTGANTITASEPILDINRYVLESDDFLYPDSSNKSTISLNIEYLENINFIASDEAIVLNQASYDLPLEMANDGTPIINDNAPYDGGGGYYNYYGDGWYVQKSSDGKNLGAYLTGEKTYNFRYTDPVKKTGQLDAVKCGIINEGSIIEDGVFHNAVANGWPDGDPTKTHKIEGGTFAAGLLYNDGVITGGAFNGKDSLLNKLLGSTVTALSGDYRSVTVNGGAIVRVNDTLPLVPDKTGLDLVQGSAWDLYSYAGTVLTVESNVDITNINGQKIGDAFSSSYLNGETNKKVVRFVMPDSDVELNSTKIVDPDPKPEPKPEPEPEAPTYTLTVKGGTFTYNGGEAMTSANVPVDAEVKVTLNQSAVPEGMVFDLWAMDEASLLGNPAVAYNQESFTIPADSVAKGSIVTVEAQYRDATIESEPSILGTAAIIGVAGAGTAVIVWQGYRIGMELYEKYFQPTPEETAAEQPAPEAPAAAAAS